MLDKFDWWYLKGTVSVISSDSPCKYGNARFTTVPLRALSDQVKTICLQCLKSGKPHFYYLNTYSNYLNLISVPVSIRGTVVNRHCHLSMKGH